MQSILLFVLVLALALSPLTSRAATLTGADLPVSGNILTITENTSFLMVKTIRPRGTARSAIAAGFSVDFLNSGAIQGLDHFKQ